MGPDAPAYDAQPGLFRWLGIRRAFESGDELLQRGIRGPQAIASGHEQSYTEMQQTASKSSIEFRSAVQKRLREGGRDAGEPTGDMNQPTLLALKALYERRPRVPANM